MSDLDEFGEQNMPWEPADHDEVTCEMLQERLEAVTEGTDTDKILTAPYQWHLENCPDCRVALSIALDNRPGR